MKSWKQDGAKGLCYGAEIQCANQQWEEPMSEAKPFSISKWEVWEAYKRVKANHGAAGVDEQSDVVGQLLSAASADGENTESEWWGKEAGHTDRIGSDCATGGEVETGAGGGPAVPSGFLRVSTGEVGLGRSRAGTATMLAL
jgi:hypothetical protein